MEDNKQLREMLRSELKALLAEEGFVEEEPRRELDPATKEKIQKAVQYPVGVASATGRGAVGILGSVFQGVGGIVGAVEDGLVGIGNSLQGK